eukprot:Gb_11839 [translate_table: standard]
MGRSTGIWILRWLDRIKPSANIRGDPPAKIPTHEIRTSTKPVGSRPFTGVNSTDRQQPGADRNGGRNLFVISMPVPRTSLLEAKNNEGLFRSNSGVCTRSLPPSTLGLWWQPVRRNIRAIGSCRNLPFSSPLTPHFSSKGRLGGVIREDIAAWMQH